MTPSTRSARRAGGGSRWWPSIVGTVALLFVALLLPACDRTDTVQRGYRGTGMLQLYDPGKVRKVVDENKIPEPEPVDEPDPEAPSIAETFKNVKVLNDLTVLEFSRLMQALSTWVAPEEGCEFCHNPNKLESDEKYTKVVARRMLEMTRRINTEWKPHVAGTGVTCWTCHRGQAVPTGDWFIDPRPVNVSGPTPNAGNSTLPYDPLAAYLTTPGAARIQGTTALQNGNRHSIKEAEWTYSLMMYISQSLGVNCTYCHTTRALASWKESTPQRATAWHGLQMVRDLNVNFLIPLTPLFPANRLGPLGDGPKVGCATCHKGVYKPLFGVSMLTDYPVLAGVMPPASAPAPAAAPSAPAPTATAKKK